MKELPLDEPMAGPFSQPFRSLGRLLARRVLLLSVIGAVGIIGAGVLFLLLTVQQIENRLDRATVEAGDRMDRFFLTLQTDLIATGSDLMSHPDADALEQLRSRNPSILDIALVDGAGTILAQSSTLGRNRLTAVDRQDWLRPLPKFGQVFISSVQFEGQNPTVEMAVTATDRLGLSRGLLVVRSDLSFLWDATLDIKSARPATVTSPTDSAPWSRFAASSSRIRTIALT